MSASGGPGDSANQVAPLPLGDDAPQRLHPLAFDRQRRIVGKLALDLERVRRVELAIHIGVNEQARIRRCHVAPPGLSVPMRSISRRRARASRDITVPMGTLVTSELSR